MAYAAYASVIVAIGRVFFVIFLVFPRHAVVCCESEVMIERVVSLQRVAYGVKVGRSYR